jgi:hypothetical protein
VSADVIRRRRSAIPIENITRAWPDDAEQKRKRWLSVGTGDRATTAHLGHQETCLGQLGVREQQLFGFVERAPRRVGVHCRERARIVEMLFDAAYYRSRKFS